MRRAAVIPGLIALAVGALLARRRWVRARRAPAPVTAPPTTVRLPAAVAEEPSQLPTARFVSVPWQLGEPSGDGLELAIGYALGEQMTLDRVDAQETPTQVFVTVIARWEPAAGAQPTTAAEATAVVMLASPLGERELVHGATDVDDPDDRPLYP